MEHSPSSTTKSTEDSGKLLNVELTLFRNRFDNQTDKRFVSPTFDNFSDLLEGLSKIPTFKPDKGDRTYKGAQLISPAVFKEGTERRNVNVERWGRWAALDVDDTEEFSTVEQIRQRFRQYRTVIYSTGSSTVKKPKFRVVFELTEPVEADRIPAFWYALNKEASEIGDAQVKDLARMYYVPGIYPDAFNFFAQTHGDPIKPDSLMAAHPYLREIAGKSLLDRLPPDMQKRIIDQRASRLNRPEFTWTSYRDCPFVNDRMIAEYKTITGTGWYRKVYALMVSIAANAVRRGYHITEDEIADICRSLDNETGGWYKKRNFKGEAARALEFVYRKKL